MNIQDNKIAEEFCEFLSASEANLPNELSKAVLSHVHRELNPSQQTVFLKMLGIHAVVSLFSLSVCSQFGFQSFQIFDAMNVFMSAVGHTCCMALCGALYLGGSALVFSLVMRPEKIKVIRRQRLLQLALLSGLSMGVFLCTGAEMLFLPSLLWVVGSLTGGILSLELGWLVRSRVRQKLVFGL